MTDKQEKLPAVTRDSKNNTWIVKDEKNDLPRVCAISNNAKSGGVEVFGVGGNISGSGRPEMICGGPRKGRKEAEAAALKTYANEVAKKQKPKKKSKK